MIRKKICIFMMSFVLLMSSHEYLNVTEAVEYDDLEIAEYDCETGEITYTTKTPDGDGVAAVSENCEMFTYGYCPEGLYDASGEIAPQNLYGQYTRQRVNPAVMPYSAIGDVYMHWDFDGDGKTDRTTYSGTGFMEGPDVMVTSGHVIYWNKYECFAKELYFVAQRNGKSSQLETAGSSKMYISTTYIDTQATEYDWGIVILNTNVGDRTGWLGKYTSSSSLAGKTVTVSGYPDDEGMKYYQYCATGPIAVSASQKLSYKMDTSGGQSGAPVFDSNGIVYGIHHGYSGEYNVAYRISSSVYQYLQDYYEAGIKKYH